MNSQLDWSFDDPTWSISAPLLPPSDDEVQLWLMLLILSRTRGGPRLLLISKRANYKWATPGRTGKSFHFHPFSKIIHQSAQLRFPKALHRVKWTHTHVARSNEWEWCTQHTVLCIVWWFVGRKYWISFWMQQQLHQQTFIAIHDNSMKWDGRGEVFSLWYKSQYTRLAQLIHTCDRRDQIQGETPADSQPIHPRYTSES